MIYDDDHHSDDDDDHRQGCQTRRPDNAACPVTVDISSSVFIRMRARIVIAFS